MNIWLNCSICPHHNGISYKKALKPTICIYILHNTLAICSILYV